MEEHPNDLKKRFPFLFSSRSLAAILALALLLVLAQKVFKFTGEDSKVNAEVEQYSKELLATNSCKGIRQAARKLGNTGSPSALSALLEKRDEVEDKFFKKVCVGDALNDAIAKIQTVRKG